MVDDAEISRVLKTTDTLKEKTEALVDEANRNGGKGQHCDCPCRTSDK